MALGIFDDIEVDERQITLNPGDWLLLYTDGITEAFSVSEEMFGVEKLYKLIVEHEFISSGELRAAIENAVNEFTQGADLSDDLTLTVISRK